MAAQTILKKLRRNGWTGMRGSILFIKRTGGIGLGWYENRLDVERNVQGYKFSRVVKPLKKMF